jgi:hypothetical protein
MVDIESADATSAPVISVRFKLASFFVEQRRRTTRAIVGSGQLHVFPGMKESAVSRCGQSVAASADYRSRPEPTCIAPVKTAALTTSGKI